MRYTLKNVNNRPHGHKDMPLDKYLRLKRISIKDFAKIIGVNRNSITNYINGKRMPTLIIAMKMIEQTNGSITYEDLKETYEKANYANV